MSESREKTIAIDREDVAAGESALEATELTPYLWGLMGFITVCTLFEYYDALILNLALPYLGRDFRADARELGLAVGAIQLGTVAAFFLVRLADRYGRRPVLLLSIVGYSLFTFLTAFSQGLYDLLAYQFVARALMVTEVGVGSIVLAEELPARYRGLGAGVMIAGGNLGGLLGALLFPWVVQTDLGWRTLYFLGVIPVALVVLLGGRIRETRRFLQERALKEGRGTREGRPPYLVAFRREHRRPLVASASLWFGSFLWTPAVAFFFAYYVINERGWDPHWVSRTLMLSFVMGVVGSAMVGPLADRLGRRPTAYLYYGLGGISSILCFLTREPLLIAACYNLAVWAMGGVIPLCLTISSELFPTEVRASANAVANNLLGRFGMVFSPGLVGILSAWLDSVGGAVSLASLAPLLCILLVLFLVPETRGRVLEEIVPDAGGVQPPAIGNPQDP